MQNMMQNTSCFQTRDPDQFSEFIHIALPTDIHASPYLRKNFYVNTVSIRLPHTGLFKIRGSNLQAHDSGSRDFVSVTIPLAGEISFLDGYRYHPFTQGTACINWKNEAMDLHFRSNSCLVINFEHNRLLTNWYKLFGSSDFETLEKIFRFSIQTPNGAKFWRFLANCWSKLHTKPELFHAETAIQEMEDNLMTLFILAIDAESDSQNTKQSCCPSFSIDVTNAEDFINTRLNMSTSIADIAQATKLHPRALFRAFNKKHGMGPATFLKQRRLEAVQRLLLGADPKSETITQLATNYGFNSMGQFAVDFRKAFGESPSETLKR